MKIASIQLEIKDHESKAQRIERVDGMLDGLQGHDLILLPEIWATGYFCFDRYVEEAEPLDGEFVERFSAKAKQLNAYLFAGSFVEKDKEGRCYNTSVFFDRTGKLIATYRKIHLFRYKSQEGEILTPGDKIVVVDTEFGPVGLSTCYDLRFPELYRKQVDLGAKFLLVTSGWPHQRMLHWNLFNRARAVENQCILVSSNGVGNTRGVLLGGNSQIVDPWGTVLASGGENETIVKAEVDPKEIDHIRDVFPQLKHRVL